MYFTLWITFTNFLPGYVIWNEFIYESVSINHHKNYFSIVGAKFGTAFQKAIEDYQSTLKKKIQALLFVTLETMDSYAYTSTLLSEIKKHLNYNSIINYNIFLHFLLLFSSFDQSCIQKSTFI